MGKRGPKSSAPGGYGSITRAGYRRMRDAESGRLRFEHVLVWESHNGPVPAGIQFHHRDGDKLNNSIGNLEAVDATTHKRLHGGCELRGGVWWKPCSICGDLKPISAEHWYVSSEGWPLYGRCRPCHIGRVVEDKRRRRRGAEAQ